MTFHVPEHLRIRTGPAGSDPDDGNNGTFWVHPDRRRRTTRRLYVIATDGAGWEHVSVSMPTRCPTWSDMCRVKALFWDPEDAEMQLHPPVSEYVNHHPHCLHLWRPVAAEMPRPPAWLVGPSRTAS